MNKACTGRTLYRPSFGITRAVIGSLALVLVAITAWAQQPATPKAATGNEVAVEVVKPVRRTLERELKIPATLIPDELVDLLAKTSGYVAEVSVDIGDRVRKGQVLARLSIPEMADELVQVEARLTAKQARTHALRARAKQARQEIVTARAEVRRYQAEHELDQLNLKRMQELHAGDAITDQALDEARSAHTVTEAQLQIAEAKVAGAAAAHDAVEADVLVAEADVLVAQASRARLKTLMEYAAIKAPFDGVITVRNVDQGAFVRSAADGVAMPLLRIAKTDRIRVVLEIPEVDSSYVQVGTEVNITLRAPRGRSITGSVARIAGVLKPDTRTMRVEVDLDNAAGRFRPGTYAQASVKLESKAQALVIPSKAIRVRDRNTFVLVSVQGIAESRPVRIGYDDGIWAEILSGLGDNELVITASRGALEPGDAVTPVMATPAAGDS